MTDSKTFDREGFVKRGTDVGLTLPIVEAFADEYTYLYALRHGETTDVGTFNKDQCVKRLTEGGLALPTDEFFANECVHTVALLRGQRHVPPSASAEGANP